MTKSDVVGFNRYPVSLAKKRKTTLRGRRVPVRSFRGRYRKGQADAVSLQRWHWPAFSHFRPRVSSLPHPAEQFSRSQERLPPSAARGQPARGHAMCSGNRCLQPWQQGPKGVPPRQTGPPPPAPVCTNARTARFVLPAWLVSGRSFKYRLSSSANSSVEPYRCRGAFSRHFAQIVSRSRGRLGFNCRSGTGSCSRTWHRTSNGWRLETAGDRPAARKALPPANRRRIVLRSGATGPPLAPAACSWVFPAPAPLAVRSLSPCTRLAKTEVGYARLALLVDQDVGRLQVAMDHAPAVGVGNRPRHLLDQAGRLAGWQRTRLSAAIPSSRPR